MKGRIFKKQIQCINQAKKQDQHEIYQQEAEILTNPKSSETNFQNSKIKAFYELIKSIKSGDKTKIYESINSLGMARLIEIEKTAADLITKQKFFLELSEDENEPKPAEERRNQDLLNLIRDIPDYMKNKDHGDEDKQTLCILTKLLTYTGIMPTYTLKAERINEIYSNRIQLINKFFIDPHFQPLYEELQNIQFKNINEEHAFWRDIHGNLDILHFALEQEIDNLIEVKTTVISRRKNQVSAVEKTIRKNPALVKAAQMVAIEFIEQNQHLENLKNQAKYLEERGKNGENLKEEIKECKKIIANLNQKMQKFREKFMVILNDLFGISLISENEPRGTKFDPQKASEHILDFQQIHQGKMLEIAKFLDSQNGGILFDSLQAIYATFNTLENKKDSIGKLNLQNNQIINEIFNNLSLENVEEILKTKLSPIHRNIFSLLFFAKKAGWQLADISDYLGIFKVDEQNRPAHAGLQMQFIDDTGKKFEIQIKDRTMYNSSNLGFGSHEAYKNRMIGDSLKSMRHGLGSNTFQKFKNMGLQINFEKPSEK